MLSKFNKLIPRFTSMARKNLASYASVGSSDISKRNVNSDVSRHSKLQFNKSRLTEFGDLPLGQIPDALRFDHESQITSLANGVKVATESWSGELATIQVAVKAGSRQETLESSGVSHFLEHLNLRGTRNRTRTQLEEEIDRLGGHLEAVTTRETTTYTFTVPKGSTAEAVDILGDILTNSLYDQNQIEAEREAIYRECVEQHRDQLEATLEAGYYTSYRDHYFGQPVKGIRENIGTVTQEQIINFHRNNYIGPNIAVVGTGDVSHEQLVELANKAFGNLPNTPNDSIANGDKPYFTPSMMFMRDDEMANINIGSFFEAPGWTHEDFYAFQLFQRILGEYTSDKYTGNHLNASDRQYNTIHTHLGNLPDVTVHKAIYLPHSDTGLFGNYFHGNEVHGFQMLYLGQLILSDYALHLNQVEVFRGKNALYNELLTSETGTDVANEIGRQVLFLGRRVPRSETATRIANLSQQHLQRVARHWFFDRDISVVSWGPLHALMAFSHYNRPMRRSTLGWYGDASYWV